MPEIVLHQWLISPFCGKVRRILEHKQLAYTVVNYNGLLARKVAKLSKQGTLPVLDYDGERIVDSSEIAVFLEAKHREHPVVPSDPVQRGHAHVYEDWADESLYLFGSYLRFLDPAGRKLAAALLSEGRPGFERVIFGSVVTRLYRKKLKTHGLGKLPAATVEAKLLEHVDAVEGVLAKQRWLVGDACSIADIAVQSQLAEIVRTSHLAADIAKRPHVHAWLTAGSRPSTSSSS